MNKKRTLLGALFVCLALLSAFSSCHSSDSEQQQPLRILLDTPPLTLNPRAALDGTGQRLGALLFRGLTRISVDLEPEPDLAESWSVSADGRQWRFRIRKGLKDHAGIPITASDVGRCLENYRVGKPFSPLAGAFPTWQSTHVSMDTVVIRLNEPDVYLASNVSLLRFFRVKDRDDPCVDPAGSHNLIGSGPYRPLAWEMSPKNNFTLERVDNKYTQKLLKFYFVRDDNTRALMLLRGDIDAAQNALSLSKVHWLLRNHSKQFDLYERPGVNVSYLAFQLRDPVLSKPEVRRAIALAIDRDAIVKYKWFGFTEVAGGFLHPSLPEAHSFSLPYDPVEAEALLDRAGFPRGPDGVRMRLRYRTTPSREGYEPALIYRSMLARIGIDLQIEIVEPAQFFSAIQKGKFQLFSSRWLGVSHGSIYFRTLRSNQSRNRVGYSDPQMDRWLDQAVRETNLAKRKEILYKVQKKMWDDVVYLPLWFWSNMVIARKNLKVPKLSMSGALEPLANIRSD